MKTYQDGEAVILSNVGVPAYREMVDIFGEKMADEITTKWMAYNAMTRGNRDRGSNLANGLALRLARQNGDERMVRDMILRKRRAIHVLDILHQRKWQASVSRRAGRQRHHDSGALREKYVRGEGY